MEYKLIQWAQLELQRNQQLMSVYLKQSRLVAITMDGWGGSRHVLACGVKIP